MKRPSARHPLCLRIPIFRLCRSGALLSEVKSLLLRWSTATLVLTAVSLPLIPLKAQAGEEEALDFASLGSGFDYTQRSYTLGWRFTAKTNAVVTALGLYDDQKNGLTQSHPVGIYDVLTRQLVASATVSPSDQL